MNKSRKGDILICYDMSQLGRDMPAVISALSDYLEKGVQVWSIKDGYKLGADINSRIFDLTDELISTYC